MATNSIPVSGLNNDTSITTNDFFPIVQSGSNPTTFRTSIQTLFNLMALSASCSSSNVANTASFSISSSFSQKSYTSSFATTSSYALVSSTSSFSITSSNAVTASYANLAASALTASYIAGGNVVGAVATSSYSLTSSYLQPGTYQITSSWANNTVSSSYALTSSFANQALTASYALTSSFSQKAATASYSSTGFSLTSINGDTSNFAVGLSANVWTTINLTGLVPSGTRYAQIFISQVYKGNGGSLAWGYLRTSAAVDASGHRVVGPTGGSDGAENSWAFTACTTTIVGLTAGLTFDVLLTSYDSAFIYLVGYIP